MEKRNELVEIGNGNIDFDISTSQGGSSTSDFNFTEDASQYRGALFLKIILQNIVLGSTAYSGNVEFLIGDCPITKLFIGERQSLNLGNFESFTTLERCGATQYNGSLNHCWGSGLGFGALNNQIVVRTRGTNYGGSGKAQIFLYKNKF